MSTMERAPLEAFTCFAELPYDLRIDIWQIFGFPRPRNLDLWPVQVGTFTYDREPNEARFAAWRYTTTQPVPTILHVNQESREVGLKYYVLSFGSSSFQDDRYGLQLTFPPMIYFTLRYDCVCLMDGIHSDDGGNVGWSEFVSKSMQKRDAAFSDQVFNIPGITVATDVKTFYFHHLRGTAPELILQKLDRQREVRFFSCAGDSVKGLRASRLTACIDFDELSDDAIGDDGSLLSVLKERLPGFLEEQKLKRSAIDAEKNESMDVGIWTGPTVKWVTLMLDGVKVGMQ